MLNLFENDVARQVQCKFMREEPKKKDGRYMDDILSLPPGRMHGGLWYGTVQ